MTEATNLALFSEALKARLAEDEVHALEHLNKAFENMHPKVRRLDVCIHMDQDAEGAISLMLHPEGPDVFVLDKAIAEHRNTFDAFVPTGLEPDMPFERTEATVAQVIEICGAWVSDLWQKLPTTARQLPATVVFREAALADPIPRWLMSPGQHDDLAS
ncbi:hypothetical protein GCM10007385_02500 [Tateyamaria omphalii]|uniref:DUF6389 family protein n=1 Tax=Tateyamaria omphalii TaxID=299262 RepID=UPI0016728EEA|nr:DUF6389 family protein [Tateyamaria omphalii]GGX39061.1 hypothetical protein GCM10007385_02500 [Tateyamaria omphalii]